MKVTYTAPNFSHHIPYALALQSAGVLHAFICGASRFSRRSFPKELAPLLVRRDHLQTFFLASLVLRLHPLSPVLQWLSKCYLDHSSTARALESDVFLFYPGCGLATMRKIKQRGLPVRCVMDYPTTHATVRRKLLEDEAKLLGIPGEQPSELDYRRLLAEIELADAFLCPSEFARRSFIEMGVDPAKLHLVGYGAAIRTDFPVSRPVGDHVFRVLYVGQLGFRKGVRYLLEAMEMLKVPSKELVLVGAEAPPSGIPSGALDRSWIRAVGVASGMDLARHFAEANVLVLPSLEDSFGLVVAEAMAYGLPVIVSENAGSADVVTHGRNGFVVPARGVKEMAGYLSDLAASSALQDEMGRAALEVSRSVASWDAVGERLVGELEKIVASA
jgi:glycosyltransferase involved in cell wall biosynthesis